MVGRGKCNIIYMYIIGLLIFPCRGAVGVYPGGCTLGAIPLQQPDS